MYIIIHAGPTQEFYNRCQTAIKLIKLYPEIKMVIITGDGNNKPESLEMQKYVQSNISENIPVKIENQSRTTIENVVEAVKKFREKLTGAEEIIIVTSNYHCLRTGIIWWLANFKVTVYAAEAKISFKKVFVEIVGILIAFLYFSGITFPERYFIKKHRALTKK